ncbi:hypothetical protein HU200_010080 [Digitaria exilis]|uniref:Uncharacterized protein n=1 Tax=Digitaria exilis TaxID=1010633 RepID=A0A835FKS3_9POAL|nr:hypothetical protein HU200_010080 [Digitaria exilis]
MFVGGWCVHPDFIPGQKLVLIPEPDEPHDPGVLFLRPHEIIHSKQDGLWYRVQVRVREVQDWTLSDSSEGDTPPDNHNSSDDEDYPGFHQRRLRSHPWPKRTRFGDGEAGGSEPAGPSLGPGWGPTFLSTLAVAGELPCPGRPWRFGRLKMRSTTPVTRVEGIAEESRQRKPSFVEPCMGVFRPANGCSTTDPMVAEVLLQQKAIQCMGKFVEPCMGVFRPANGCSTTDPMVSEVLLQQKAIQCMGKQSRVLEFDQGDVGMAGVQDHVGLFPGVLDFGPAATPESLSPALQAGHVVVNQEPSPARLMNRQDGLDVIGGVSGASMEVVHFPEVAPVGLDRAEEVLVLAEEDGFRFC